jgi:hypothetical protein
MTGSDCLRNAGIHWGIILKCVIRKSKSANPIQVSHDPAQCCTFANTVMTIRLVINSIISWATITSLLPPYI